MSDRHWVDKVITRFYYTLSPKEVVGRAVQDVAKYLKTSGNYNNTKIYEDDKIFLETIFSGQNFMKVILKDGQNTVVFDRADSDTRVFRKGEWVWYLLELHYKAMDVEYYKERNKKAAKKLLKKNNFSKVDDARIFNE